MADTPVKKGFWKAIRAAVGWVAHILLIPVVAILKALISGLTYLHDEAAKV